MHILNSKVNRYKLTIQNIRQEAPYTLSYDLEKPADQLWEEGAYVHVAVKPFDSEEAFEHKTYVRHFSIASLPNEPYLTLTTRVYDNKSAFKARLSELKVGDTLEIFKFANHMKLRRREKPAVIISSGVGVATARPMVKAFTENRQDIPHLIHLHVDKEKPFIYNKDFTQWSADCSQLLHIPVIGRQSFFEELEIIAQRRDSLFYLIGSDDFILDVRTRLIREGIPAQSIYLDKKPSFYELHGFEKPLMD